MLTAKQERFVAEYLIDLNAAAAYRRAGYKSKGEAAKANAARLIANDNVASAIRIAKEKRANDLGIDAKYVLATIKETIDRCRQAYPVLDRKGEQVVVATPTGDIVPAFVFDAGNVLKGADMLAKHVGLYEVDNDQSRPVTKVVMVPPKRNADD